MEAATQERIAFYLTGEKPAGGLEAVEGGGLRPALFAGYEDLTRLRYDFPLVLLDPVAGGAEKADAEVAFAEPISAITDAALADLRGHDRIRIGRHALRLERELRRLVSDGAGKAPVRFSTCWERAAANLASDPALTAGEVDTLTDSLTRLRSVIRCDGEIVDCDAALPTRLLRHAFRAMQAQKAARFRHRVERLARRLSDVLQADFERSPQGRTPERLQASLGAGFGGAFDCEAMAQLLARARPAADMSPSRRVRIEGLLEIFRRQRFFPAPGSADAAPPYSFVFENCAAALLAWRQRMPELVTLARAIAVAELEVEGQYSEARHDALFERFGAHGLDARELAGFPDYLVCLRAARVDPLDHLELMEALASGLPIKVLIEVDDLLGPSRPDGMLNAGTWARMVASMAIGLNQVFVLQSSASHLFRCAPALRRGLAYRGAALFSVYSGASGEASGVPAYLMAAAAMDSRAFPAFTYDHSAGSDWAARFDLAANAQVELDWPTRRFAFEDHEHQRVEEELAFTLADFAAADRRYAHHLARVPAAPSAADLVPVDEALRREENGASAAVAAWPEKLPCLRVVDAAHRLHTVVVDQALLRETARCRELWHSLQELGGVHNSHAAKLLARERKAWEERLPAPPPAATPAAQLAQAPEEAPGAAPVPAPDKAYIETPRCSSCNECIQLNPKMFAYNADKQAYIADVNAGTFAQLVEAAESCQVSIIHPGKPRDPNEPGLPELIQRAQAFL